MNYHQVQGLVEKTIIHTCMKSGMPLPARIAEAPVMLIGLGLFWEAFWDLMNSRPVGMALGHIPWTAVNEYANVMEIVGDQRLDLYYHVRKLDEAYLVHANKEK